MSTWREAIPRRMLGTEDGDRGPHHCRRRWCVENFVSMLVLMAEFSNTSLSAYEAISSRAFQDS